MGNFGGLFGQPFFLGLGCVAMAADALGGGAVAMAVETEVVNFGRVISVQSEVSVIGTAL